MKCEVCSNEVTKCGGCYRLKEGTIICHNCAEDIVDKSQQLMVYKRIPPETFFNMDSFQKKQQMNIMYAKEILLQLVEKIKAKPTKL